MASAQGDQLPPWSIQGVATSVLRKIKASATPAPVTSPWKAAAPYPTNIYHYGFAQNGEDFYIISGFTSVADQPVTAVRRYNVITNTWTSLADIPLGSYSPPSVYYHGKLYVLDGVYYALPQVLRIYDIATDTWTTGPSRPHPPGHSNGDVAGVFDGNIYVAGSTMSRYNIASNTWSDVSASFFGGGSYVQIGQYLYVMGGIAFGGMTGIYNSGLCRRFDMATNTWSIGPVWSFLRRDFALAAVGNRLIAIGGDMDGGYDFNFSSAVAELDTSTWPDGAWVQSSISLPSPRVGNNAGFVSTSRAGGEIWSTGGAVPDANNPAAATITNEHLFLAVPLRNGGSAIVSAGPNGVLDPGETVTVLLGIERDLCTNEVFTGTLQASGGVTNPSEPQTYSMLCPGHPVFRNFTFTVDPALPCGSDVTVSLVMTDGAVSYGTLTYVLTTGNLAAIFAEDFDDVVAPMLPKDWVASNVGNTFSWVTSTTDPESSPNDIFITDADDGNQSSERRVDTPAMTVNSAYTKVIFRQKYDLQPVPFSQWYPRRFFDGGVLEMSSPNINGGAFTDLTDSAVGGSFVTGGYNGVADADASPPLQGRMVWGQNSHGYQPSGGYITTIANLGPAVIGQMIKLRFRMGTRSPPAGNMLGEGWRIDNLFVGTPVCGGSAPQVISAVSRKVHGAAGSFDIDLPLVPLDGNIGIENRNGTVAGQHQVVVSFASPVTMAAALTTTGAARVDSYTVSGPVVTINLTGVPDAQKLGITLSSVSDGVNLGSVMIPMGVLSGDTNGNGSVTSSDIVQIKSQSGQPVTASNFREDVVPDGSINSMDVSAVKLKSGVALPP